MNCSEKLRKDAYEIVLDAVSKSKPDYAVKNVLEKINFHGKVYLIAVGKAAWQMAYAAHKYCPVPIEKGIVLTKYGHIGGAIENVAMYEAGHPVPDENGVAATEKIISLTKEFSSDDTVLFLLSGGASALFESPLIPLEDLKKITEKLLMSGAGITEINTVRKRLSAVKGGKFAKMCLPAKVEAVILSDVLGDRVDMIASGPVSADTSTSAEATEIALKYGLDFDENFKRLMLAEPIKNVDNVNTFVIGSVGLLCLAAKEKAEALGYDAGIITDSMCGEASTEGRKIAEMLLKYKQNGKKTALIFGGETVVHVKGKGVGGRNQELSLSAASVLSGEKNVSLISIGSDGTDGPTDAAGGYVDGDTVKKLCEQGINIESVLSDNDSYTALSEIGGLVMTGPTGTNVNDLTVGLINV